MTNKYINNYSFNSFKCCTVWLICLLIQNTYTFIKSFINNLWISTKEDISRANLIIISNNNKNFYYFICFKQYYMDNIFVFFTCFVYYPLLTIISLLLIYIINLNYILNKNFNLKKILKNTILFRLYISLLFGILGYYSIDICWLYFLIICLTVFSLTKKKEKIIVGFLKLLFLLFFWLFIWLVYNSIYDLYLFNINNENLLIKNIVTIFLINYISDSFDIFSDIEYESQIHKNIIHKSLLKNFIYKSLAYYNIDGFEFYSNLTPENSKEILNAIDKIVKDINLEQFGGGNGGPDWNPDLKLYIAKGLFLDGGESPDTEYINQDKNELEAKCKQLEANSKEIDDFNKTLIYLKGNEMIKEKNILLSFSSKLDYHFQSKHDISCYEVRNFRNGRFWNWFDFWINMDINSYNQLTAAKYYYEHKNDKNLPDAFHKTWLSWYVPRAFPLVKWDELDIINSRNKIHFSNLINKELAYGELNDNLLIVGLSLSCRIYIYEKLLNFVGTGSAENPYKDVSPWEIHLKYWELYKEYQDKYYMFFQHYQWHTKLHNVDNLTKEGLEHFIKGYKAHYEDIKSLPPIESDYEKYQPFTLYSWKGYIRNPNYKDTFFMKSMPANIQWPGMEEFIKVRVENKVQFNPCKADVYTNNWLENQERIIQRDIMWETELKELNKIYYEK